MAAIRIGGSLIEISEDGTTPLQDQNTLYAIQQALRFTKVNLTYTGKAKRQTEERVLYAYDDVGRLVCQRGWFRRIVEILRNNGHNVVIIDERPPLPRPDCYTPDWDNLVRNYSFRPGQRECILRVAACIGRREGGVIEAAPAFGKTKVISMICALYPRAKIDVITYGNELIGDLFRHIASHTSDVGCTCGGSRSDKRISIISSMSLHYADYGADIVLADEVHKLMTDRAAAALGRYDHACMFGFTATKDTRYDNMHKRMEGLFGPTIFSMMWQDAQKVGLIVPIMVEWYNVPSGPHVSSSIDNMVARKRIAFWRNEYRNRIIADAAIEHVTAGHQTLVLVETIEHMLYLYKFLPDFAICCGEDISQVPKFQRIASSLGITLPKISRYERMQLKTRFEQREIMGAIATPVWATGVSFDSLQVLVRADGGGSETNNHQWPGRVARIDPQTNKSYGILVDFIDRFDRWAYGRSLLRRKTYKKNGWVQLCK